MPNLRKHNSKRKAVPSDKNQSVSPVKKKMIPCSVAIHPLATNRHLSAFNSDNGMISVARERSVKERNQPSLTDSSEIDSSDEDEGRRMKRFIKERNRIQQTKQDILRKLAIVESTREMRDVIAKENVVKVTKKRKIRVKTAAPPIQRQSLRLQKKDPRGIDLPPNSDLLVVEENPRNLGTEFPMKAIGFDKDDISVDEMYEMKESFEDYDKFTHSLTKMDGIADCIFEDVLLLPGLESHQNMLQSLHITPRHVQKVTRSRIFSIAVHPSLTDVLIAIGDKQGYLGLWKPMDNDANNGKYMFKPHISPISCLKFSTMNCNKLYMCSYDGQLRTLDLEKTVFDQALVDNEDMTMSGFDFMDSAHSTLITSHDSSLSIIDARVATKENVVHTYEVHKRPTKCVSCHPLQKYYVSTSHRDGHVFIFDVRKAGKRCHSVAELKGHARSVSSAYFSPVTGKHVLTTSYDNRLRIFDTSTITSDAVKLKDSCYHFNQTGRWLSSFRATWHPMSDDVFTVGSMNQPRQIDIYSSSASPLQIITDQDHLTSICSITCFHRTRNILVGGNSSGKAFMFSGGLEH